MMTKETIKIGGMSCAACASRIEKMIGKLEGVSVAAVNFATEKLLVEYDNQTVSITKIKETVERIG